jgi:uncharacterized protein (TIGR03067 family)
MKRFTASFLALGLSLSVFVSLGAAETDKEKLQGAWQRVSGVRDGKRMTAKSAGGVTLTIEGKNFVLKQGDKVINEGTLGIGTKSNPRAIDLRSSGDEGAIRGLFRFKEGKLETCFATPGAARPASFSSRAGTGQSLFTWERAEAASAADTSPTAKSAPAPAAPAAGPSPLDQVVRMRDRLPKSPPPVQVIVNAVKGTEFELQRTFSVFVPATETFRVQVNGQFEDRQRTVMKPAMRQVVLKGTIKDLRLWTVDGKLVPVEPEQVADVLRKGEPILLSETPEVDPAYLQIYKAGTVVFISPPQQA